MGFLDDILVKMKLTPQDDDYDDYDDGDMDDEIYSAPGKSSGKLSKKADKYYEDEDNMYEDSAYVEKRKTAKTSKVVPMKAMNKQAEVCMIMPKGYEDANEIADILLQGKSVVLNLEGMQIDAAQRVIDFASGACYTMGGNLQKISKKIFIVTPSSVELSGDFTNLLGDSIDLSSLNLNL